MMSKPFLHAQSAARRWGGTPQDYMRIEDYMDSSKCAIADSRHRAIFHTSFGIFIVEKMFGQDEERLQVIKEKYGLGEEAIKEIAAYADHVRTNEVNTIKNSAGKLVSIRDVAEQHVLEDFGNKFIPTVQDYLENLPYEGWMENGKGYPPSFKKLEEYTRNRFGLKQTQDVISIID